MRGRSSLTAIPRRAAVQALAALCMPALTGLPAVAAENPEQVLGRGHGLIRLPTGIWGLPLEAELKEKLAGLPSLRESVVTAEKELNERVAANRRAWNEAAPAMEALQQALGRLAPTDPQRAPLARQIKVLEGAAVEPTRLSTREEVRGRLVAFSRDRALLQLALLWIRAQAPRLAQEYGRLARLADVAGALQKLGERLGPQKDYAPEVKRLAEYDKLVFTSWLPIYQQAGQTRVTSIVNDQGPVTFSWNEESDGRLLLPASVLEPCGLAADERAPARQVRFAGRSLAIKEVLLPSLRLGRHVLKNLSAWSLPPEGEDLGAWLPRNVLTGLRVNIELDRLRLTLSE